MRKDDLKEFLELGMVFIEAILFEKLRPGEEEATKESFARFREAFGLRLFPASGPAESRPSEWSSGEDPGQLAHLTIRDVVWQDQEPERRASYEAWREREERFREGGGL